MLAGSHIVSGVVAFVLFMDYLIYGLLIPLIPYSPAHATSEEQFGLLYGAYSVGVLAATPVFGYLGDRIGYRRPMISGVLLSANEILNVLARPHITLTIPSFREDLAKRLARAELIATTEGIPASCDPMEFPASDARRGAVAAVRFGSLGSVTHQPTALNGIARPLDNLV
jgi:MFS family permease